MKFPASRRPVMPQILRSKRRIRQSKPLQFEQLESRKVFAAWAIGIDSPVDTQPSLRNAVAPDGSVFVAGSFVGNTDFDPTPGSLLLSSSLTAGKNPAPSRDAFVAKYDPQGGLAWARKFGGTGIDTANVVTHDPSGAVLVAGEFSDRVDFTGDGIADATSSGGFDAFLVKLDATTGATLWYRTFGGNGAYDEINDVAMFGGHIYTTGAFSSTADLDPGAGTFSVTAGGTGKNRPTDAFVQRLDGNGNFVTAWQMGGTGADYGYSLQVDSGGIYLLGNFTGTADFQPGSGTSNRTSVGSLDAFLAHYSTSGNLLYAQVIAAGPGWDGSDWSLALQGDRLFVTGDISNTVDLDPSIGSYLVSSGDGYTDALVAAYDRTSGAFLWADTWGQLGTHESANPRAAVNPVSGEVYVGGSFYNTLDFTPAISGDELTSAGDRDGVLVKYDSTGNFLRAWRIGGQGWDSAVRPAGVLSNTVYVSGWLSPGIGDFPSGDLLTVTEGRDGYVATIEDIAAQDLTAVAESGALQTTSEASASDLALFAFLQDSELLLNKRKARN